jgi:hypothetical protein
MVEVLARDNVTGRFLGLQVKTAVPMEPHGEAHIGVRKATFLPAPRTYIVALAWIAEQQGFADECLVLPTTHLTEIAIDDGPDWRLNFHPHSPERTPLDPYRQPLSRLHQLAQDLLVG